MRKLIVSISLLTSQICFSQTTNDTINFLKDYSQSYLDLLFNKRNIDSAMGFWSKGMLSDLKRDYSNHKQPCNTDSSLKVLFGNDINKFCNRVTGKIDFFATDDKEGVNIIYLPGPEAYYFLIHYNFYGDFACHNLLMRTFLNFQSFDKGKTWVLIQDNWIQHFMVINYFRKDLYGSNKCN